MARISFILLLIILLCSCNQKHERIFFWLSSDGKNYEKLDSSSIGRIKTETFISQIQRLTYFSKDTVRYYVKLDGIKKQKTNIKSIDSIRIRPQFDTTIQLETNKFLVHNYIINEDTMDGSTEYYWTPSIGVYAVHSSTWPGLTIVQTNHKDLNTIICQLVKATVPPFFVRGKFTVIIK